MRILIVAMTESIHTARWVNQLTGRGWDVHLFPSLSNDIHPDLRDVTVHCVMHSRRRPHGSVRVRAIWPFSRAGRLYAMGIRGLSYGLAPFGARIRAKIDGLLDPAARLARLLDSLKPDVVHSLEIQHAGYLTLEARRLCAASAPWIVTNWGSDVYFFGRLPSHSARIKEVLAACDWYSCECHRDVALARQYGLRGRVLPVFPNAGGFDLDTLAGLRAAGPVSARRWVIMKGYQNWAGRAQVGLRALELCADVLKGYQIAMYSTSRDIEWAAEMFTTNTGIPVKILPHACHREMMAWFGRSRMYLGLSASDGISTSMLESMVMGAFPVQSNTACANEWVVHGETGMIVPHEDPHIIAEAIRRALTDDALVDTAAERNYAVARVRLDRRVIMPLAIDFYRKVCEDSKGSGKVQAPAAA